jgi:O-antigen/teichoic acid export membrane protein
MGIVFRQSVKTTISTFLGAALGALITYTYTFALSKTQLGLNTNIIFTGAIGQILVMMGTGNLIVVFAQRYSEDHLRKKALITLGMLVTTIGSLLFAALFFIFKDNILGWYKEVDRALIDKYYVLVPLLVFLWGIMSVLDCYLIAHVKIAISSFAKEIVLRICNLLLLLMLLSGVIDFTIYITCSVLIYLVPITILFFVSSKTEGFGLTSKIGIFSKQELKEMAHFSWYHLLMIASFSILGYMDTLMLGPLDKDGIQAAAAYTVAVFLVNVMYMPYRAMAFSSLPILNQAYIDKDDVKIRDLFSRAGINIFIVAVAMFLIIGLNLDNAVAILPEGYGVVKPLVIILMLGKLVDMFTGLNNELISISKHYKFNFRAAALLLIGVYIFDRIYIPEYGVFGAAWVTTIALAIFNVVKMLYLYTKMGLHPLSKNAMKVLFAGILAAIPGYFLPFLFNPIADAFIRTVIVIAVYGGITIWFRPSQDLTTYIENIRSTKRLF